jgi:hypothetical protein
MDAAFAHSDSAAESSRPTTQGLSGAVTRQGCPRRRWDDRLNWRDPSNVSNLTPGESIPEWRLVPHDNNIGQRNVTPVLFVNLKSWLHAISRLRFTVKNPHADAARMLLCPTLPHLLSRPGEGREISVRLVGGEPVTAAELAKSEDAAFRIEAYANGILVGGMTYPVGPRPRQRKVKATGTAARRR